MLTHALGTFLIENGDLERREGGEGGRYYDTQGFRRVENRQEAN